MGRKSKRKGAEFENEMAKVLTAATGTEIHRVLGQARDGGHDLRVPPGYLSAHPLLIEAKRRARLPATAWLEQIHDAARRELDHPIPLVIARGDRAEPIVIMKLAEFLRMLVATPVPVAQVAHGSIDALHGVTEAELTRRQQLPLFPPPLRLTTGTHDA